MSKKEALAEKEKRAKRQERADSFWSAFQFTENGKPKSSLIVYTFSLSILFAAAYFLCYEGAIRLLTGPLSSPARLGKQPDHLAAGQRSGCGGMLPASSVFQ